MKKEILFMITVTILLVFFIDSVISLENGHLDSKITRTASTEIHCNNGKCFILLYSGVRFVEEEGKWKDIREAKSLKNSGIKCVVESDGKNLAECVDFNYTHRKIKRKASFVYINDRTRVPIRVMRNEFNEVSEKFELVEKSRTIEDLTNEKEGWIKASYGDIIKIGDKSTTIKLSNETTENLEDTYVYEAIPDTSYPVENLFVWDYSSSGFLRRVYIKFNISAIPPGQQIDNATLYLLSRFERHSSYYAHHVYNQSWKEEDITWNNQPCGILFDDSALCNVTAESVVISVYEASWNNWSVVSMVSKDYTDGYKNLSISIRSSETDSDDQRTEFYSKESDPLLRPYLNITYSESEVPDTTPPTFSSFSNNASSDTVNGTDVQLNVTITDGTAIDFYRIATNNTDGNALENQSLIDASDTTSLTAIFNESIAWFPSAGGTMGWQVWANDTGGYSSVSAMQTLTVRKDDCIYTSGNWGINRSCTKTEETINIEGNLTLYTNGNLTLINSSLNFTSIDQWIIFENTNDMEKLILNGTSTIN